MTPAGIEPATFRFVIMRFVIPFVFYEITNVECVYSSKYFMYNLKMAIIKRRNL